MTSKSDWMKPETEASTGDLATRTVDAETSTHDGDTTPFRPMAGPRAAQGGRNPQGRMIPLAQVVNWIAYRRLAGPTRAQKARMLAEDETFALPPGTTRTRIENEAREDLLSKLRSGDLVAYGRLVPRNASTEDGDAAMRPIDPKRLQ
ncbi:MAG: hypothetical protein ABT940_02665 [Alphaproteobacteria bacterium]